MLYPTTNDTEINEQFQLITYHMEGEPDPVRLVKVSSKQILKDQYIGRIVLYTWFCTRKDKPESLIAMTVNVQNEVFSNFSERIQTFPNGLSKKALCTTNKGFYQ